MVDHQLTTTDQDGYALQRNDCMSLVRGLDGKSSEEAVTGCRVEYIVGTE